ncbi:Translation machinery-associated protein 22 [Ascosphaera acerosa]|nr:Translation machinery-associated protein 22 [Ascosphaera acerosa]
MEPQPAREVLYCEICSLPPEYCEFTGTKKRCEEWLKENHPDLHERLYSEEAISANLSTLSVSARERAEKDAKKKEAKAALESSRQEEKKAASRVLIKRVERNKRKHVTVVVGLEHFGLDVKKAAKEFGKRFATGSSVTKAAAGGGSSKEEITIQGDVSDDILDWLLENHPEIPEDNIELVEDKKKKAST